MKSKSTIRRHLRELRKLIDTSADPVQTRIAYAMEQAVRWATLETHGWPQLAEKAKTNAQILRRELGKTGDAK